MVSDSDEDRRKRLIVIDDPISSLSQNYVFEIASLIQHPVIRKAIAAKLQCVNVRVRAYR